MSEPTTGETVPVECPNCDCEVWFPQAAHDEPETCREWPDCRCVWEGEARDCPTCGSRVEWRADGEDGWAVVTWSAELWDRAPGGAHRWTP